MINNEDNTDIFLACTLASFRIAKPMRNGQQIWVKAIQQRVAITSSMLGSMKSVKMLGISETISSLVQSQRVRELSYFEKYRMYVVWMNVAGKQRILGKGYIP